MILYLDTSALVKRYFAEPYTDEILLLWRQATGIITSAVAYAESMAAFHRKKREASLDEAVVRSVVNGFHKDWAGFIRVEVTADLIPFTQRENISLVTRHNNIWIDGIFGD